MILTAIVITHGHRGVRAGAGLPVVQTDHRRRGRATTPRTPGSRGCPPRTPTATVDEDRPAERGRRTPRTPTLPDELDAPAADRARAHDEPSSTRSLTPLPVLIPMLAAAVTLVAGRRPRLQRVITLVALIARRRGVRGAAVPRRPRRHDRPSGRRLGPDRAGHRPLGITLVVDRLSALMLVVSSIVLLAVVVLRHRAGHPRRRRPPAGVDLPAHLPGAVGGRVHRVPGRRPVQPVRRLRGAAGRQLRAADHRRQRRAGPRRHRRT